jgi:hypothetical protein
MKCSSLNSTYGQPWRDPTYRTQTGIRVGGILSVMAMLRQQAKSGRRASMQPPGERYCVAPPTKG